MYLDTKKVLAGTEIQRAYLWEVVLPQIPNSSVDQMAVSALIQKVKFGHYNFTDLTTRKQGPFTSNAAGTLDIQVLELKLINTIDNIVTQYFQDWKATIIDPSGYYFPKSSYAKTVSAFLYDTAGNVVNTYTLVNVFPKTFPAFDLSYESSAVHTFDVTLSVDYILDANNNNVS